MRDEKKAFQLLGETSASIYPLAGDIMGSLIEKYFTERRFYQPLFLAFQLTPEPLSADLFCKRTPYTNPAAVKDLLVDTTEAGYLKPAGRKGFRASKKGADAIETVHKLFYKRLNEINQFPEEKLTSLTDLLGRLVDSASQTNFQNNGVCLDISRNGHPPVEIGSLARVDQLLDDLNAFRDDAHIAAWKPVGVDGHTWETLSFVWNGQANTAEKLLELLPFRYYALEDYTSALEDLADRGWIEPAAEGYTVTDVGKKIRDGAESDTDDNYFSAWKVLIDDELALLGEFLSALKETNLKLAAEINPEKGE
ncbi:MAG: hypothetical protein E4H33_03280 [Anaerolineales bacterium]|nr:MAG: hypothetical protein E4H33_03280 [Anaerolineales bacterium]